jgi:hypothetical protein
MYFADHHPTAIEFHQARVSERIINETRTQLCVDDFFASVSLG